MTGDNDLRASPMPTRWRRKGFSIIELLVVVSIFSMASLMIAATFVSFSRLHRRVANAEVLGEDLRFVAELLVRAARNNIVDYPTLPGQFTTPTSTLQLVSLTSTSTIRAQRFTTSSATCAGLNASCLALSLNGGGTWTPITGKNVAVDAFRVYITPTRSPFQPTGVGTYDNNNQPRVTFQIDASYVATSTAERATLSVQTSVSSRIYVR